MKTLWLEKQITYTGEQLKPLVNYLDYGVLGDSCVAWRGPCKVEFAHMIDGEDLRAQAAIAGDDMVHFVLELFDFPLKAGVLLQRLMAEMTLRVFRELGVAEATLGAFERRGDDLFLRDKKLNISIATASANSVLIHFAVNARPLGAPVPVLGLSDLNVEPQAFARALMKATAEEVRDVLEAAWKVRCF